MTVKRRRDWRNWPHYNPEKHLLPNPAILSEFANNAEPGASYDASNLAHMVCASMIFDAAMHILDNRTTLEYETDFVELSNHGRAFVRQQLIEIVELMKADTVERNGEAIAASANRLDNLRTCNPITALYWMSPNLARWVLDTSKRLCEMADGGSIDERCRAEIEDIGGLTDRGVYFLRHALKCAYYKQCELAENDAAIAYDRFFN